jgi:hypothetical protein
VRRVLRALLTSAFVATVATGGMAGVASAAPLSGNGIPFELYEELCFDTGTEIICFEVHGRFTLVTQNDGDQVGTGAVRMRSFVVMGGRIVSAQIDHSVFQSKIVDGVFDRELTITQSRTLTPGQQCVAHMVLKVEGGEVVVDQSKLSCN